MCLGEEEELAWPHTLRMSAKVAHVQHSIKLAAGIVRNVIKLLLMLAGADQ